MKIGRKAAAAIPLPLLLIFMVKKEYGGNTMG